MKSITQYGKTIFCDTTSTIRQVNRCMRVTLLLALIAGCGRSDTFKLELASRGDNHNVGEQVFLAGNAIGTVTGFDQLGSKRYALVAPMNRAARLQFRSGLERKPADSLELSAANVAENAPLLSAGSEIRLRNPIENTAKEGFDWIRELWQHCPWLFVAVTAIAALFILVLLRSLCGRNACVILLTSLSTLGAISSATATAVRRDEVERDIQAVETLGGHAQDLTAEARRLAKAGLDKQAQEQCIRAFLAIDRAAEMDMASRDGVERLSGFAVGPETKRALRQRYEQAARQRGEVEEKIADLAARFAQSEQRLVPIYLLQRDAIKMRLHSGVTDDDWLLQQLARLAQFPPRFVNEKLVTLDNLSACRFENNALYLADGTVVSVMMNTPAPAPNAADIRFADLRATTDALREDLNLVKERAIARERVVTNITMSTVVMVLPATNMVSGASMQTPSAIEASPQLGPSTAGVPQSPPASQSFKPAGASVPRHLVVPASVAFALVLAFGVAALVWFTSLRGRPHVVSLSTESGEVKQHEIAALEEALFLGPTLVRDHISSADPSASIVVSWRGTVLRPGTSDSVSLNEITVTRPSRLHAGNQIKVSAKNGGTQSYDFLGCEPVTLAAVTEATN